MQESMDVERYAMIRSTVESLEKYFRLFNKGEYDEAMQRTIIHAMTHFDEERGELEPYIKSLARFILQVKDNSIPHDFVEQPMEDTSINVVDDAIRKYVDEFESDIRIVDLALSYMKYFIPTCEALINNDRSLNARNYPSNFKEKCLNLARVTDFKGKSIALYNKYGDTMKKLLELDRQVIEYRKGDNPDSWVMSNQNLIDSRTSKRIKLVSTSVHDKDFDLDKSEWKVSGNLSGKCIIKVPYREVYEKLCDYIDGDVEEGEFNPLRMDIDDMYIVRTLGGNWSGINPILAHEYRAAKEEILTNLIQTTRGRYLGEGSECFYFVVSSLVELKFKVSNMDIEFSQEVVVEG